METKPAVPVARPGRARPTAPSARTTARSTRARRPCRSGSSGPPHVRWSSTLDQEASGLEVLQNPLARFEPVQPSIGLRSLVQRSSRPPAASFTRGSPCAADLEVVRIVAGRHLDRARPELQVDVRRRAMTGARGPRAAARVWPIAAPVCLGSSGCTATRGVAEHRLRARRRHHDALFALDQRVADVVQLAVARLGARPPRWRARSCNEGTS